MSGSHSGPWRATLKDVAREAGISNSTAARARRDHPDAARLTRERVQRIARELGYVPNLQARSLRSRTTQTIGVVHAAMSQPLHFGLLLALE